MKRIWGALAVVGLSCVAVSAQAGAYLSLGYAQHKQDDRFFGGDTFDTGDVVVKLGGEVNRWFGVEMRAGTTANSNKDDLRGLPGVEGEYRMRYFYGAYARLNLANPTFVTPYILGGHTWSEEKLKVHAPGGGSYTDTWDDNSYGAGLDFSLSRRFGLNLEYMFYRINDDNVTIKGPSASAVWRF